LKKVGNRHTSQNVCIFLKYRDQHHTDPSNHLEKLLRKQSNPYPKKTYQLLFYCLTPRKANFIIKSTIKQSKSANFILLLNLLVVSLHLLSILVLTSQVKLYCCSCIIVLLLASLFISHLVQNLHLETKMCSANTAYVSIFQPGFCKWLPGVLLKQTEIGWDKIHIHSSMRLYQYHCFKGFLQKVG